MGKQLHAEPGSGRTRQSLPSVAAELSNHAEECPPFPSYPRRRARLAVQLLDAEGGFVNICPKSWSVLCRRSASRLGAITPRQSRFNRGSFLVIIPGRDQDERHGMRSLIVVAKKTKRVLEGLSTTGVDVPAQAPRCPGVIEARPYAAYRNLAGILTLHPLVEVIQIVFSPSLTVGFPP